MRGQVQRIVEVWFAGFIGYKMTVAAFGEKIPGQPFYGFGLREWLVWIISPTELTFILAVLTIEYGVLYPVTRRLSTDALGVWALLLGAYVAILLFPFDLLTMVDQLPDRYWPPGPVGSVLAILVFFGVIPLLSALCLRGIDRARRK